jgi:hypothetical protein
LERVVVIIAPVDAEILVGDILDTCLDDQEIVFVVLYDQNPGSKIRR